METLMFYLLIFIAVCQAACLVLLILTAGKNRKEKPEEPEPVRGLSGEALARGA